jgi:trans-aconitate methyltransferase
MGKTSPDPIWKDGAAYEKFMGQRSRLVGREFIQWLESAEILGWVEVGCGTGAFTQIILDRGQPHQIYGIEPA